MILSKSFVVTSVVPTRDSVAPTIRSLYSSAEPDSASSLTKTPLGWPSTFSSKINPSGLGRLTESTATASVSVSTDDGDDEDDEATSGLLPADGGGGGLRMLLLLLLLGNFGATKASDPFAQSASSKATMLLELTVSLLLMVAVVQVLSLQVCVHPCFMVNNVDERRKKRGIAAHVSNVSSNRNPRVSKIDFVSTGSYRPVVE